MVLLKATGRDALKMKNHMEDSARTVANETDLPEETMNNLQSALGHALEAVKTGEKMLGYITEAFTTSFKTVNRVATSGGRRFLTADQRQIIKNSQKSAGGAFSFRSSTHQPSRTRAVTGGRGFSHNRGRSSHTSNSNPQPNHANDICYKCGQKGHRSPACPSKR